ncbi:DNA-primase RepB domain-containing protein [Cognatiyoonia sp. IB215182]|nr:DNA-primase RepB domain-containing protein [Cognatiyoonia sp. IB215182]
MDDYATPALWNDGWPERVVIKDQEEFLAALWELHLECPDELFVNLCFRKRGAQRMIQKFRPLKPDMRLSTLLWKYDRHHYDQYFSPNVYVRRDRRLVSVADSWLGWSDVDSADPYAFQPHPSVIWQTSPGRTQAIWFWDAFHDSTEASAFSKALAYRHGGDKAGSAANKILRLPGSFNHKPEYGKPFIPMLHFASDLISERPTLLASSIKQKAGAVPRGSLDPFEHDRMSVFKKYRRHLSASTRSLIRHTEVRAENRSDRIYAMVAGLAEAGATPNEIAAVIWGSPYFQDKYHSNHGKLEEEVFRILDKVEVGR